MLYKLKDLVEIKKGVDIPAASYLDKDAENAGLYFRTGDFDGVGGMRVTDKTIRAPLEIIEANKKEIGIKPYDILFSVASGADVGALGKTAFITEQPTDWTICNNITVITVIKPEVIRPKFLYYWLSTKKSRAQWEAKAQGVKFRRICVKDIEDLEIYLPSLERQDAVIKQLETYDRALEEELRAVECLKQRFKKCMLQNMFV